MYRYTKSGLLNLIMGREGNIGCRHNEMGNVTSIFEVLNNGTTISYSYDNNQNVSGMQVTAGEETLYNQGYTYDNLNRMTKVTDNIFNKDVATYTYDGAGNISTKTLANGVTTSYTYNMSNGISSVTNKLGNTTLSSYAYNYYLDGNKEKVTDNNGRVQSFVYDSLGQLKTETDTLNGGATTNYAYDVYGNRTSMTVTGANPSQTSYIYDANNRMTRQTKTIGDIQTIADYAYDNNGNMVSKLMSEIVPETEENPTLSIEETETTDVADSLEGAEAIFYTYDVLNRLTGVTADNGMTASYEYDSQNRRIGKTVNGVTTEYIWNGDNVIYESGTTEIRYSYGNDLESIINGTTEHYYLKNGHGDITQLTDSTGTIAEDYTYDAFGNQLSDAPTVYNPFRYSGEYFDQETGLTYLRARYYDSSIGHFISEDPIKDGLNWYVYCGNNPVMFIDPSGYITEDEQQMFENGEMSPGAYTFLMLCTYYYYLQDTDEGRAYWSGKAQDFRDSGYTDTGDWYWNSTIEEMSEKPNDYNGTIPLSQEEHYFRNGINLEFTWDDLQTLQERLPDNMKWDDSVSSDYHQNNTVNGQPNKKYVSACGHFEIIYNANNELQTIDNNWQYMGTYNYYSAITDPMLHFYYDVMPYYEYGNVPVGQRGQ